MSTHSSILFFLAAHARFDLSYPKQGLNPCPLQWKFSVLTTGLPGKSSLQYSCLENPTTEESGGLQPMGS